MFRSSINVKSVVRERSLFDAKILDLRDHDVNNLNCAVQVVTAHSESTRFIIKVFFNTKDSGRHYNLITPVRLLQERKKCPAQMDA